MIYNSYRDTPKEVYEESLEVITSKLYEAQEVTVWEENTEITMQTMQTNVVRGTHTRYPSVKF